MIYGIGFGEGRPYVAIFQDRHRQRVVDHWLSEDPRREAYQAPRGWRFPGELEIGEMVDAVRAMGQEGGRKLP